MLLVKKERIYLHKIEKNMKKFVLILITGNILSHF